LPAEAAAEGTPPPFALQNTSLRKSAFGPDFPALSQSHKNLSPSRYVHPPRPIVLDCGYARTLESWGMAKTPENGCDGGKRDAACTMPDVNAWFVREVLPLEAALKRFLRHGWRNDSDVGDMCQDVFVRTYEAARVEIPQPVKPFVFAIARNLLINRLRREQIVSIDAVADLDTLGLVADEPTPDRTAMARQELRRLQAALDHLPERWRDVVLLRKVEGLSRREIADRMGLAESTVAQHLASGIAALVNMFHSERSDSGRNS
jgi:RNA polymerase sigma factor (sigma-70 family)